MCPGNKWSNLPREGGGWERELPTSIPVITTTWSCFQTCSQAMCLASIGGSRTITRITRGSHDKIARGSITLRQNPG